MELLQSKIEALVTATLEVSVAAATLTDESSGLNSSGASFWRYVLDRSSSDSSLNLLMPLRYAPPRALCGA